MSVILQAAINFKIDTVLIDERKGRKLARRLCGLTTFGSAGLLVQAKRAGLLDEIAPLFEKLQAASYWISRTIVDWALQQVEE